MLRSRESRRNPIRQQNDDRRERAFGEHQQARVAELPRLYHCPGFKPSLRAVEGVVDGLQRPDERAPQVDQAADGVDKFRFAQTRAGVFVSRRSQRFERPPDGADFIAGGKTPPLGASVQELLQQPATGEFADVVDHPFPGGALGRVLGAHESW